MENEFFKIFNKTSNTISLIASSLTSIFGFEWFLFAGYLILNITDYLTGIIKSKINKTESSSKGIIGIIKKFCYWILISISFFLSFSLTQLGKKININLDFVMLFGWFTLTCLIINESRSIIENLVGIGLNVPNFLKKGLEISYHKLENNLIETNTDKTNIK